jgi:hypothetical protein
MVVEQQAQELLAVVAEAEELLVKLLLEHLLVQLVEMAELVYQIQFQAHHYLTLVVVAVELITLEMQEQVLLAELVEQVYLEQVAVLPDQLMMELLIEEEVVDLMVKHLDLMVIDQEMVVRVLFI